MSLTLRAYVGLIALAAALLVVADPEVWLRYASISTVVLTVALLVLCVAGELVKFQVQSGWSTHGGTVPHIATAMLLPPPIAAVVSGLGTAIEATQGRSTPFKALFNSASVMLSVGVAAVAVSLFGGPDVLQDTHGWRALLAGTLASVVYYIVSAGSVAVVVALHQRRPVLHILRGKLGLKALTEIGLGLFGATLAVVLSAAPGFLPGLTVPAVLILLGKRAVDRAARRARDLALTSKVGRAVAGTLSIDLAFDAVTSREVRDRLRLDGVALLPLGDPAEFRARVAADTDLPALRAGMLDQVARNPQQVHLWRPAEIPTGWLQGFDSDLHLEVVATPCGVGGSAPVGALIAWRSAISIEPFKADELLLLETLADYAAVALETTRLFNEAVHGRADAEEREARIRAVMDNVADGLLTFDDQGRIDHCNPAAERIFGLPGESITGQQITSVLPGVTVETSHHRDIEGVRPDGSPLAVEVAVTTIPSAETPRYIAVVRDIGERKAFEEQLRHMAFHDDLTGLPNRALFMDRVEHALARAHRQACSVAVLFIDLDNFKVVNDSLGHAAGDRLLKVLSSRLRAALDAQATLARFGGDEFTVLLEDIHDQDDAFDSAQRIRDALRQPISIAEHEVFATASIGIAVSTPGQSTPGELVRNADVAMYRAKSTGRGRSAVYDQRVDSMAVGRLELETELRRALDHDELEVYYQPIVELGSGLVRDMEALVRWRHPQHGLIPPDRFIPLAEESGLIIPMGMLVLETACRQLRDWRTQWPDEPDLSVSVNLSARQFQHPTLAEDIARVLRETGLQPNNLMLEITETIAMRDAAATASILADLKQLGVRLAIDDFGTGYSSLSYLHRFPTDVLKIDRSFIGRLGGEQNDRAIVEAVIALARGLDMEVTAEGIETAEQLSRLTALGCHRGQGYFFARPMPGGQATEYLAQSLDDAEPDLLAAA